MLYKTKLSIRKPLNRNNFKCICCCRFKLNRNNYESLSCIVVSTDADGVCGDAVNLSARPKWPLQAAGNW